MTYFPSKVSGEAAVTGIGKSGVTAVSNKIDGLEIRPVRVSAGTAVRKTEDSAAGKAGSGAPSTGDGVHITSTARTLANLEQAILDMPAIDQERVDEVQRRIASGQYQADPQRIADSLLRLESDLTGLRGK
jgi:negative regulator of flagellin synthesis FlgM